MVAGFQFHRRVRPLVLELVRAEADERDELRAQLVAEIEADDDLSRSAVVVGGRDGILLSHSRGYVLRCMSPTAFSTRAPPPLTLTQNLVSGASTLIE